MAGEQEPIVEIRKLWTRFDTPDRSFVVHQDLDLTVSRGEVLSIVASFCYAGFTLLLRRARDTLTAPQALLWMSLTCCLFFAVAAGAVGDPMGGYDRRAWLALVGLGLLVQLLGWWLNSWGLGHVAAAVGAIALQAQQVATLFLAIFSIGIATGSVLNGRILDGRVLAEDDAPEPLIDELFADERVAFVHARALLFGCFTFAIERA